LILTDEQHISSIAICRQLAIIQIYEEWVQNG
jgi:hypothetical protein